MSDLISKLGIDGKILIAQIVNFFVLLIVLYKFLYKPLLGVMDKRKAKIEKSLKEAEKISERMTAVQKEIEEKQHLAKKDAVRIIDDAKQNASTERQRLKEEAVQEITALKEKAKQEIADEKASIVNDLRSEIGEMVVDLSKKVLGRNLNEDDEKRFVASLIQEVKKEK